MYLCCGLFLECGVVDWVLCLLEWSDFWNVGIVVPPGIVGGERFCVEMRYAVRGIGGCTVYIGA